jgi:hypothetical protein
MIVNQLTGQHTFGHVRLSPEQLKHLDEMMSKDLYWAFACFILLIYVMWQSTKPKKKKRKH